MSGLVLHPLARLRFRTNPTLDLVPVSALSRRHQRLVVGDNPAARSLWLMRSRNGNGQAHKVISPATASLLGGLRRGGTIRGNLTTPANGPGAFAIARLVLDHYLEIETDGAYVGGPAAHTHLVRRSATVATARRLDRLTDDALHYASALALHAPAALARRLYAYNTLPETRVLADRLPDAAAVSRLLGLDAGAKNARALLHTWRRTPTRGRNPPWIVWTRIADDGADARPLRYKVYISPTLESVRDAFETVVQILPKLRSPRFKVGRDREGMLRPDKCVVYFRSRSDQRLALRALRTALAGIEAHGVPFSAATDDSGLLSWGIDPSKTALGVQWSHMGSWRSWVATRLATHLLAARSVRDTHVSPVAFSVDRLALDGVDTRIWAAVEPSHTR